LGVLAWFLTFFVDDMTMFMSYLVDAPVEELYARHHRDDDKAA
jgi:hypothetical protein